METITADNCKRVQIPDAVPGQVFAFTNNGDGTRTLTEVTAAEVKPAEVRFEKRGRFTVGVSERPVNMEAVREMLAEFP
jgi:hypothetical protein